MKVKYFLAGVLSLASASLLLAAVALGDDDDDEKDQGERSGWNGRTPKENSGVLPVVSEPYRAECAVCHMAYSPGLLPSRSWEKMLAQLDNHFGDNAELDTESAAAIRKYLMENSAEQGNYRQSAKFLRTLRDSETPLRISETAYFKKKHDEIPAERMVTNNPQVRSFANCTACHAMAEKGDFSDDDVRVPGFDKARF